jgi:hypothetical protein
MLTEIYLCHACSCQEILRTETAGQGSPGAHSPAGRTCAEALAGSAAGLQAGHQRGGGHGSGGAHGSGTAAGGADRGAAGKGAQLLRASSFRTHAAVPSLARSTSSLPLESKMIYGAQRFVCCC